MEITLIGNALTTAVARVSTVATIYYIVGTRASVNVHKSEN